MKKYYKAAASILAIATMMSSITSVSAGASSTSCNEDYYHIVCQELESVMASGSFSYYSNYDSYTTANLSPTKHYLSAVAEENQTLPFGNIYFYINMNAISATAGIYLNHTDSTRFTPATYYYTGATISNIASFDYTAQIKRISLYWDGNGTTTAGRCNELFRYDLGHYTSTGIVNNEMALHRYTSQSPTSPSTILTTTCGNDLKKIVYSIGDVDRDGDVDLTDKQLILKYIGKLMQGKTNRTNAQKELDKVAFCLAADCNEDGEIDVNDVTLLSSYLDNDPNVTL